jgi:hypothetical protein
MPPLILSLLPDHYAICRLPADSPLPPWATIGLFVSVTRTTDELSITCPQINVPPDIQHESGWRILKMEGPFDLSLTGILAPIATALAEAKVNIFALSTYDTDYVLVKDVKLPQAIQAIEGLGHKVQLGR